MIKIFGFINKTKKKKNYNTLFFNILKNIKNKYLTFKIQ